MNAEHPDKPTPIHRGRVTENGHEPPAQQPAEPQNPWSQVGQQLGLGPDWQPAPAHWWFDKLTTPMGPLHVIRLTTAAGTSAIAMDEQAFRRFIAQAQSHLTGLVLPD